MSFYAEMKRNYKPRSGIAIGGIGTGSFELRQDGLFYNWSIFNNSPVNLGSKFNMAEDSMLFFLVRFQEKGKEPLMRLLQVENNFGAAGIIDHPHYYIFPWLSGVDKIEYSGSFPFLNLKFYDSKMPFVVEMNAFSPFIPHDVKNSSLPGAIFNLSIHPVDNREIDVTILASMRNAVAYDQEDRTYKSKAIEKNKYKAFEMSCGNIDRTHSSSGSMGIASLSENSSYYLGWEHRHPYYERLLRNTNLGNIDDTDGRNAEDKESGRLRAMERCFSSIGCHQKIKGKKFSHKFIVSWHFPNRYAEDSLKTGDDIHIPGKEIEGHYYSNFFNNSSDVSAYIIKNLDMLENKTAMFHKNFFNSSIPENVLDQINSNLNTFRTSSWLSKKMDYGIIEGLEAKRAFAGLATTDVAMYGGIMTAALFPELDKNMIKAHLNFQNENGSVAHSIMRNFKTAAPREISGERLDMPSQFVFMALRQALWSGDRDFLRKIWPGIKKAMNYVLAERDMNNDGLPDMEGIMCSYDNFPMFGVASYVCSQWLAAAAAVAKCAKIMKDPETEKKYRKIFKKGTEIFEDKLWNGEYYRLCNDENKGADEGCLSDQIIGQWAGHQIGLGTFFNKEHVQKALNNIWKMNFRKEQGLRNCQWPGDGFLHEISENTWVDQANTVWTGVELAFASLLFYEKQNDKALELIENVDKRYRKWGMYWDHQEFGGHYFRAMSAWGIINAVLGLEVCDGEYKFAPKIESENLKLFFTHNNGTAQFRKNELSGNPGFEIEILTGEFICSRISIRHPEISKGKIYKITDKTVKSSDGELEIIFHKPLNFKTGEIINIRPL